MTGCQFSKVQFVRPLHFVSHDGSVVQKRWDLDIDDRSLEDDVDGRG